MVLNLLILNFSALVQKLLVLDLANLWVQLGPIEWHNIPKLGFILMGFLLVVNLRSDPQAYYGHIATKWLKVIVMMPKMDV